MDLWQKLLIGYLGTGFLIAVIASVYQQIKYKNQVPDTWWQFYSMLVYYVRDMAFWPLLLTSDILNFFYERKLRNEEDSKRDSR